MDPWNKPNKPTWGKNPPPNVDEMLNNLQDQIKNTFNGKNYAIFLIPLLAILWGIAGFYTVKPAEQAVTKLFGKFQSVVEPGPHFAFVPFQTYEIENTKAVRRLEIGFRTIDPGPPARTRRVNKEALMLTGDENIVDVQFTLQYRIIDLPKYLFEVTDPQTTIRVASESSMREVIGKTSVDDAITTGKRDIEVSTATLLQSILDSYNSGIEVENVKLQDVHPPDPVKEAFKDVASAKEDREKMINEAYGYQNNLIPKSRGEAAKIINDAQAYAEQVVLIARGKAQRFNDIYEEYKRAKDITKERIRIETMEEILPHVNKVIADPQLGKNFLPFLPIQELQKK